jgi:hypothetical protein
LSRKNKDMRYSMFFYSPFGASVDEYAEPTLIWKRDESVETVKIGDYEYDKKEFEEATKHLKPVNK